MSVETLIKYLEDFRFKYGNVDVEMSTRKILSVFIRNRHSSGKSFTTIIID